MFIFEVEIYVQKKTDKSQKIEDFFLIPKCSPKRS